MTRRLIMAGALALAVTALGAGTQAAPPTMAEVAQRLYEKATPASFDRQCTKSGGTLEVDGARHSCKKSAMTTIVRFADDKPTGATVHKEGLHKNVVGALRRKLGAPDSVKTMGFMKMHFWFTDRANISVGLQDSAGGRSTMVSFRAPS